MSDVQIPPPPPTQLTDSMSCAVESDPTKIMKGRTHCCVLGAKTSDSVRGDTPSRDATMNGENETRTVARGGDTSTGNTVKINGSDPTLFERNIIIHGGQGGKARAVEPVVLAVLAREITSKFTSPAVKLPSTSSAHPEVENEISTSWWTCQSKAIKNAVRIEEMKELNNWFFGFISLLSPSPLSSYGPRHGPIFQPVTLELEGVKLTTTINSETNVHHVECGD
ncbi:hypothetical protein C8R44DRAFT_741132 [Mycena epipterygia]|nr:hypothetical protein C8R44DRAFT_741132 [Mycena epipterygia]